MIKPQVAISSCLLGEQVRYDGQHKLSPLVVEYLVQYLKPLSICPEVGSGMPVPRPPIQILKSDKGIELQLVAPPHTDFSNEMQSYFKKQSNKHTLTAGLISKSRSPSCGVSDTPIFKASSQADSGAGYHVRLFQQKYPHLPIVDENRLEQPDERHRFLTHCFTIARYYELKANSPTEGIELFHSQHELLFQSLNYELSQQLTNTLDQLKSGLRTEKQYLLDVARLLKQPFSQARARAALENFILHSDSAIHSTLSKLLERLKCRTEKDCLPGVFFSQLNERLELFQLQELKENVFFSPYPEKLMTIPVASPG